MLLRKISSIIERINSRYLFALGGIAVLCLLMAIVSSEGGSATMLWLIGAVLSVCIFFVILILKIAYYFIAGSVSATKETLEAIRDRKSSPKKPKKKNIPLIVAGIVVLVAVTPYVGEGGALIPILQVCGLIVVLIGFGVPWKRKKKTPTTKGVLTPVDIDDYAVSVGVLSARIAIQIQERENLNDRQASEIMIQLAVFSMLMLVRDMENASVSTDNAAVFIYKTLRDLGAKLNSELDGDTAHKLFKQIFTELSDQFGNLPLTSDSDKQGGTLLWEYAKHMNESMGKETLDLEAIMYNISTLAHVRKTIDTSAVIKYANTLDKYKEGYKKYL